MTSCHVLVTFVGFTHASRVIPVVRCKEAESLIVTRELVPLNTSAFPYFPPVVHVVFDNVPLLPLPEMSFTTVPVSSSKLYAATRPEIVARVVAVAVLEYGLKFPAASVAFT